jgi:peptidylprolyl isomerase
MMPVMKNPHGRSVHGSPVLEVLEKRSLLSAPVSVASELSAHVATDFAAKAVKVAPTKTTLTATAGTLGQPVTFTVTVRAAAAAGSPVGTVEIFQQKTLLQTLTLSPTMSASPKNAFSDATYTLDQPVGGSAYFFGKHAVTAEFIPAGTFAKSAAAGSFNVTKPVYTTLSDGVKYESIAAGTGPAVTSGETVDVSYTGYLAKNGKIFDDTINDGGTPFSFTLGAGDVITGFDQGTQGMQAGETRIVDIPPADGYGATADGPIPKNSTLLFVITLDSVN